MVETANVTEKGVTGAHIFPWWNSTSNHSRNQALHGIFFEWWESQITRWVTTDHSLNGLLY